MQIPYSSPVKIKEWQERIKDDVKKIRDKGFAVSSLVMNPNTIVEIMNWKHENEPMSTFRYGSNYFANYPMIGNPEIDQYDYRLEVSYV